VTPEEIRDIALVSNGKPGLILPEANFLLLREIAAHLAEQNAILRDLKITGTITAIFAPPEVKP